MSSKARKSNISIYKLYIMFSHDLLFYYAIRFMFLSEVKHFEDYEIVFGSFAYCMLVIAFQFVLTLLISKIGKRKGAIIGNSANVISTLLIIYAQNYYIFLVSQLFSAIAFSIKSVTDENLLFYSEDESEEEKDTTIKAYSKAYKMHYIFGAIATVLSGIFYKFNPYIPMTLCLYMSVISTILALCFIDISPDKEKKSQKEYAVRLKKGIKSITKSKKLRSLIIFIGTIWGAITIADLYELELLQKINVNIEIIGVIYAVYQLLRGISTNSAGKFKKLFKNKALTSILLVFSIGFMSAGAVSILGAQHAKLTTFSVIAIFFIISLVTGISQILSNVYINGFANSKNRLPIYLVKSIAYHFCAGIITLIGSGLLKFVDIKEAIIILGGVLLIITMFIYIYSKDKLGIKNEE